jgi:hypothetical protein
MHGQNNLQIDFFAIDSPVRICVTSICWKARTSSGAHRRVAARQLPNHLALIIPVRAINSRVYSAEPAIVSFKILPPLWRRWWFIALAILLVGAMVFALDRYRVARLRVLDTLNRKLKLEYDLARLLSESSSTLESAPRILEAICEALDWDVGVIWDVDRRANLLRCVVCGNLPALKRRISRLRRHPDVRSG